jgi:tetratricopeptide (TPR) repeat protein
MDHVPTGVDRRTLARLSVGAVLLGPVMIDDWPEWSVFTDADIRTRLDALQRHTANLAARYDHAGPARVAACIPHLESGAGEIIMDGSAPARLVADAKAEYAKLMTIFSSAAEELGDLERAIRAGTHAASIAQEIGSAGLEGDAWWRVAGAHCLSGRRRTARNISQRAYRVARNHPAGTRALLTEALSEARMGNTFATFDLVGKAERAHERLPDADWGEAGYEFGTVHPSTVKAHAGAQLCSIGLYDEAKPRLDEAAELLAGSEGSSRAYVWLLQASCMLGTGDLDGAVSRASAAVAHEARRPSAWVRRRVREMDKQTRSPKVPEGPFTHLVDQTKDWGVAAT